MIEIRGLNYKYNGTELINDINVKLYNGEIIGIIGESGSGKSIFLKLLSGKIKDFEGEILINNRPIQSFSRKELHKCIFHSYKDIPENPEEFLTNFLLLSRVPLKKFLNPFSDYDIQVVEENIRMFELERYRNNTISSLPDGILKKAILAFLFTRNAKMLLMDNPTSDLDIHSISLLHKAINRYVLDGENIVIMALNDLDFILQTSDRILLLKNGKLGMEEHPANIDVETIREHFDTDVFLSKNIYNGRPNIHFFPEN